MKDKKEKTSLQPLKGFRDFLPREAIKRQWLKDKLIGIFENWGYDPLETPTLEPLEIFQGEIGEGENLFYKFKDLGGRDVALRYDQTVPTCRVVAQYFQQLPMPFRRYQIQPAFRAEKPQKGRYREFVQCDADIFGIASPYADAELIALSLDIYRQLGFKQAKVLINNRALLKNIPYKALVAIDKLKKNGKEKVITEMMARGISKKKAGAYLKKVINTKPDETIKIILSYLEKMNFDKSWYKFEPTIVRSFSYSSGPIWEVEIPGFKGGSVLGGERFDKIITSLSGLKVPATGFGLGFDRTLEAAEQFNLIPDIPTLSQVLITIFSPNLFNNSLEIIKVLRKSKVNSEIYPDPNVKLDKQLKYADKKEIPWVVIIGPEEVEKKVVVLKNMESGEQEKLTLAQLISKLKPRSPTACLSADKFRKLEFRV